MNEQQNNPKDRISQLASLGSIAGYAFDALANDLSIDFQILVRILSVGLSAGIQAMITAFSNVFVQSYINSFGSDCSRVELLQ